MKGFVICLVFGWFWNPSFGATRENLEENEVVELMDDAANVCINQEVQNQIINITYIQSQVRYPIFGVRLCISIFEGFCRF